VAEGQADHEKRHRGACWPQLLVCDIDDTLTGDREGLTELKSFLREMPEMLFAVATGRHLPPALRLIAERQLPQPSFLITAVGTEIHDRRRSELSPDEAWRAHIGEGWDVEKIDRLLTGMAGIEPQEASCQSAVKRSYLVQSGGVVDAVRTTLREHPCPAGVIWSHGTMLDVIPERASKGAAVAFLARRLGIPLADVVAAGDSGNDEAMLLEAGRGVVVDGPQRAELKALNRTKSVYFAGSAGPRGVLEGLRYWQAQR
jgi:sucrose-phosphate synthase